MNEIKKLNDEEKDLLVHCLKKYAPNMIAKIGELDSRVLSPDDINEMRSAVGGELADKGFRSDSEPNEYGFQLEDLISRLANLYLWPDKNEK